MLYFYYTEVLSYQEPTNIINTSQHRRTIVRSPGSEVIGILLPFLSHEDKAMTLVVTFSRSITITLHKEDMVEEDVLISPLQNNSDIQWLSHLQTSHHPDPYAQAATAPRGDLVLPISCQLCRQV